MYLQKKIHLHIWSPLRLWDLGKSYYVEICTDSVTRQRALLEELSTLFLHLAYLKLSNFPLSLFCHLPSAIEHDLCLLRELSGAALCFCHYLLPLNCCSL